MPNPSPLHDPMAKLFFPGAPLVPQLRSAAEHDEQHPDKYGYSWTALLGAAADRIEQMEAELEKHVQPDNESGYNEPTL